MRKSIWLAAMVAATLCSTNAVAATFTSASGFHAAAPTAVLIEDFEHPNGPLDAAIPSLTQASGTYVGLAGVPFHNVFVSSAGYTNYGPGIGATTSRILTANGDEWFDVSLAHATKALGLSVYLNDLGPAAVTFMDGANILGVINFVADTNNTNNLAFAGFTSGTAITRFQFKSSVGGSLNTGIDNIYAAPLATGGVPEPASWALMLGGFALTGAAMRRRGAARIVTA